jgi:hypothetical protein
MAVQLAARGPHANRWLIVRACEDSLPFPNTRVNAILVFKTEEVLYEINITTFFKIFCKNVSIDFTLHLKYGIIISP